MSLRRICVFCGSSDEVSLDYLRAARAMGESIAAQGLALIYGGGGTGMMGALAGGVLDAGGQAIGVTINLFNTTGLGRPGLSELHVFETLHERKAKMVELADGFIALPGGLGTLDELVESLTWAQLGLHNKPIGLLNPNGYFDPFLLMLDQAHRKGFLYAEHRELLVHEQEPDVLLERMKEFRPQINLAERWLKQSGRPAEAERAG